MVGAIVLSQSDAASPKAAVGLAQRVVEACARAPRDAVVHIVSSTSVLGIWSLSSRGALSRSYS